MRVVIFGGRDFTHRRLLDLVLDRLHARLHFTVVIEGDASGVDRMAGDWARKRGLELEIFAAEWKRCRKRAGPLRNQRMIDEGKPDYAVAFPGGDGTADMWARCAIAGVERCNVEITDRQPKTPHVVRVEKWWAYIANFQTGGEVNV